MRCTYPTGSHKGLTIGRSS